MEFRPCPSFPGYSVSLRGVVRRDGRKSGKPVVVRRERLALAGTTAYLDAVVYDAWPDLAPLPRTERVAKGPYKHKSGSAIVTLADGTKLRSSYNDGRIMTVAEWREVMRRSTMEAAGCD